jgi:hypothetical protein
MARPPTFSFDRGTLLLHPPPPGKAWIDYATWGDRVERFRLPALQYRRLVDALRAEGTPLVDYASAFEPLPLVSVLEMTPYPHQCAALATWRAAGCLGGGCPAHRRRQDLPGAARPAGNAAEQPDRGADVAPHSPVVCASRGRLPQCTCGAPSWGSARLHAALGGTYERHADRVGASADDPTVGAIVPATCVTLRERPQQSHSRRKSRIPARVAEALLPAGAPTSADQDATGSRLWP